jgi:hypothetical protein
MSRLSESLKKLKGLNKPAIDALERGASQEAHMAELAAEEARKFQLNKAAEGISDPLTANPFKEGLKDIDISALPDNSGSGFQLVGGPQSKGFVLGEAGEISRPPVVYKPKIIEPEVMPKQLPAVIDADSGFVLGEPRQKSKWERLSELANEHKGKIAAGLGTGAVLSLGSLKPEDQMLKSVDSVPTSTALPSQEQKKPQEIKEPDSEEEKVIKKQIASLNSKSSDLAPTVIDFGNGDTEARSEGLREAQSRAHILSSLSNFQDSNKGLAYDIAGVARPEHLSGGEGLRRIADSQVPAFEKRVQFEKEDPNSPQSKGYRALAKSMGFEITGTASAADIEKQFPQLANIYNQKNSQKARHEDLMMKLASLKDSKSSANADKLKKEDEDRLIKLNQQLNSPNMGSARNALGRNQLIINGAEKINALINSVPNQNELTGRQVYEIAKSLDGMLSMGSPTISGTDKLLPRTIMGKMAELGEYGLNKPIGAQMGKFVKQMQHLIDREKGVAQGQNHQFSQRLLGGLPKDFSTRRASDIQNMLQQNTPDIAVEQPEPAPSAKTPIPAAPVGTSGLTPEQRRARILELQGKQ